MRCEYELDSVEILNMVDRTFTPLRLNNGIVWTEDGRSQFELWGVDDLNHVVCDEYLNMYLLICSMRNHKGYFVDLSYFSEKLDFLSASLSWC